MKPKTNPDSSWNMSFHPEIHHNAFYEGVFDTPNPRIKLNDQGHIVAMEYCEVRPVGATDDLVMKAHESGMMKGSLMILVVLSIFVGALWGAYFIDARNH